MGEAGSHSLGTIYQNALVMFMTGKSTKTVHIENGMTKQCYGIENQFTLAVNREVFKVFSGKILNDNPNHTLDNLASTCTMTIQTDKKNPYNYQSLDIDRANVAPR